MTGPTPGRTRTSTELETTSPSLSTTLMDPDDNDRAPTEVLRRLDALPPQVTNVEIAWATGRRPISVQNWVNANSDFPAVAGHRGRKHLRNRVEVKAWYFAQSFSEGETRGRPAGRSTVPAAAAQTAEQVRKAFEALGDEITREGIAKATGRAMTSVNTWIQHPDFPAYLEDMVDPTLGTAQPRYYSSAAVLEWYLEQPFAQVESRRGPKDSSRAAYAAVPRATRLSTKEIAAALGRYVRTVQFWASRESLPHDPFPPADPAGLREWAATRSWVLRMSDPLPTPPVPDQDLKKWVLRHVDDEDDDAGARLKDEHGLTVSKRDAIERARVAQAAGLHVPLSWLGKALGVSNARVQALLDASARPLEGNLPLPWLADKFGVDSRKLRYLSKQYATGSDPFPAADAAGGRDPEAVGDWLARRGIIAAPAQPHARKSGTRRKAQE